MKQTLAEVDQSVRRKVRQETLRAIRARKTRLEGLRANRQALLESMLSHTTQLAGEISNRRQSQEHLARMRAEADYIRRSLPRWPEGTTRDLPREGSEGYKMQERLKELAKYRGELRARIADRHRLIVGLRAMVDREKRELLTA